VAFSNARGLNDLAKRKAESLLVELSEARPSIEAESADDNATPTPSQFLEPVDPPTHDPQKSTNSESETLHSNPLKQSDPDPAQSLLDDLTITAVIVTTPLESDTCASIGENPDVLNDIQEGVGVSNLGQNAPDVPRETPPLSNSNEKG
jgi:hypothetical protein